MELTGRPLLVLMGAYFDPIIDDTYSRALSPTVGWFDRLGAFASGRYR